MNCKQGDLALIKPPSPAQVGKLVEVCGPKGLLSNRPELGFLWFVRAVGWTQTEVSELTKDGRFLFPDSMLRPLRDADGLDETLTWKSVPTEDRIQAMRTAMRKEKA